MAAGASSSAAARQRWELENTVQRDEQVPCRILVLLIWGRAASTDLAQHSRCC